MSVTIQNSPLKYVVVLCVCLSIFVLMWFFKFPVTPSIDKTVLCKDVFSSSPITNGDYVLFTQTHELIGGTKKVIKKVGCVSGQILDRRQDGFYCDNKFIKPIRLFREAGDPLPQFEFSGPVPKGKIFLYGTHQYSFGSRHWGFVDISDAQKLIPII